MIEVYSNNQALPMTLMERLANHYKEKIIVTIDSKYRVCVHISNIDRISKKKYLSNLEGCYETVT